MSNFVDIKEPDGHIIAIGDVHGHLDELKKLIDQIENKFDLFSASNKVIFLGDYIDRGDQNKETIEFLLNIKKHSPNVHFLRGNHEDMFLSFMEKDGSYGDMHHYNGGGKVYENYGVPATDYDVRMDGTCRLNCSVGEFIACFPAEHIKFIENTEYGLVSENFVFVHAGIQPKPDIWDMMYRTERDGKEYLDLGDQTKHDMMWIRDGFIGQEHKIGKIVVHGHTPSQEVYFNMPYEINVDTGIAYGKKLSAVSLKIVNGELEAEAFSVEKI